MELDIHSLIVWPPSPTTRLKLVDHMIKILVTPSIWSRQYGVLSKKEAEHDAKQTESLAFDAANQNFLKESDGDGTNTCYFYAQESKRLLLQVIKRGSLTKPDDREPTILSKIKYSNSTTFDISGRPRKLIDSDDASDLLKFLTDPRKKYTKICFSNTSFGCDAALVAGPILASINHKLTEVDLSDFVSGRPEDEALQVMNIFSLALNRCFLNSLNLSNNALGEKGIRAFEALLKSQDGLTALYLMNAGISEEAAMTICELIPSTYKMKVLHFHNNMTGDEGALGISKLVTSSPLLENFRCSSTRIGSKGGILLSRALGKCKRLKKIDLRDNVFGVHAGLALSKALYAFSNLTEIYLSYLNLEDEGSIAIANGLKDSAPRLEVLDMGGNEITAKGAVSLAKCIGSKWFLVKLNLGKNELKDEGAILIAKALEEGSGQLLEVDMSSNMISRAGAWCLVHAVVGKPGFKMLNINGNFISDKGDVEVKDLFKNCFDVLRPFDENDPEGEDNVEQEGDGDDDDVDLESRLTGLEIKPEE